MTKALIRRDNYKSKTFFCFSKGEKDVFQKKRFYFKKNHLKRISLKWKGFLHQMKRNSTLKWKGFPFLKIRWNEMKKKLFLPTPKLNFKKFLYMYTIKLPKSNFSKSFIYNLQNLNIPFVLKLKNSIFNKVWQLPYPLQYSPTLE